MTLQAQIEQKLQHSLSPEILEVLNESHLHKVPTGSESHFKVTVVSEQFADKRLVARHRMVNQLLAEELNGKIHALALHTLTPDEYFERAGKLADSPQCLGGSAN
ncbi:MAG: BolA family transcriptional regulator [Proteobacteria bacterium]|nr:MAG: BolA family transcriptional regulator [Pseudomonadota bacterium]